MLPPAFGRIGLAGAHIEKKDRIAKRACNLATGGLYLYPDSSTTVDATKQVTFKWDTSCPITSSTVDLYLYEPSSANGLIHAWTGVTFSSGQYTATLLPKWWNATTSASLQLSILNAGADSWNTQSPPGPVFKVEYAASAMSSTVVAGGQTKTTVAAAAATQSQDAVFQNVSSTQNKDKGISKGAIAAAVVVPLVVLAIIIGVAIRFWRAREAEKRRRWSQALSTHSNLEWEKGAQPGEKPHSILGRPSTQHSARPMSFATSSVYAVENNMAGAGAGQHHMPRPSFGGMRSQSSENVHPRTSVVGGHPRQSRISFADTARPDRRSRLSLGGDIRPTVQAGGEKATFGGMFKVPGAAKSATELNTTPKHGKHAAYATGSAIADDDEEESINVSPSQMQGPHGFGDAEVKRAGKAGKTGRRSMLGLGGGNDQRRMSTASALSADDFKSAASARGSVDELRDMEAVMLMRRSVLSAYSANKSSPNLAASPDPNTAEPMEQMSESSAHLAAPSPMPTMPSPIAGSSTVAYGPDQMLAVYAARSKARAGQPAAATPLPHQAQADGAAASKPVAQRQNSGMRLLGNLKAKATIKQDKRLSDGQASEGSRYSQAGADVEDHVGEAK